MRAISDSRRTRTFCPACAENTCGGESVGSESASIFLYRMNIQEYEHAGGRYLYLTYTHTRVWTESRVWRAIALAAQDGNQNSFHNTPRTGHCSLHTYPQLLLRWRIERECRSPNSSSHGLCFARPYALRLKDSDHSSHPVGILFENTNSGRRGSALDLRPECDPQ